MFGGATGRERIDVADRLLGWRHSGRIRPTRGRRPPRTTQSGKHGTPPDATLALFTWFPSLYGSAKVPNRSGRRRLSAKLRFAPSRRLKSRKNLVTLAPYCGTAVEPGRGRCEEGNAGFGQDRAGGRLRRPVVSVGVAASAPQRSASKTAAARHRPSRASRPSRSPSM